MQVKPELSSGLLTVAIVKLSASIAICPVIEFLYGVVCFFDRAACSSGEGLMIDSSPIRFSASVKPSVEMV